MARGSCHHKSQNGSVCMDVNWEDPQNSSHHPRTTELSMAFRKAEAHKVDTFVLFSFSFCALLAAVSVASGRAAVLCHLCHFRGIWDKSE